MFVGFQNSDIAFNSEKRAKWIRETVEFTVQICLILENAVCFWQFVSVFGLLLSKKVVKIAGSFSTRLDSMSPQLIAPSHVPIYRRVNEVFIVLAASSCGA